MSTLSFVCYFVNHLKLFSVFPLSKVFRDSCTPRVKLNYYVGNSVLVYYYVSILSTCIVWKWIIILRDRCFCCCCRALEARRECKFIWNGRACVRIRFEAAGSPDKIPFCFGGLVGIMSGKCSQQPFPPRRRCCCELLKTHVCVVNNTL